jgi:hypothetical protein
MIFVLEEICFVNFYIFQLFTYVVEVVCMVLHPYDKLKTLNVGCEGYGGQMQGSFLMVEFIKA